MAKFSTTAPVRLSCAAVLGRFVKTSVFVLGIIGASASGCAPEVAAPAVPPPPPPPLSAALAPVVPAPITPSAPPLPIDPNAVDVAAIPLVLEDPRLAAVKAEVDQE